MTWNNYYGKFSAILVNIVRLYVEAKYVHMPGIMALELIIQFEIVLVFRFHFHILIVFRLQRDLLISNELTAKYTSVERGESTR